MPLIVLESRTLKSVKNIEVATLFYFLNLLLQFFSRKIFLDYLGSEVLGLNTTAQNLLGFLNIAELGIGAAVAYNLYKPLQEKNRQAVIDIVSVQGWLYQRIAAIVGVGAIILMLFFPMIFSKAEVPLWYAYGSFGVLLLGALLDYTVNYKQIVLSADQKQYKITYSVQGVKIIKILFQVLAVRFLANGYVYWMVLEALMSVFSSFVLNLQINKEYPWLKADKHKGKELRIKYPGVIQKTKQVFFHKIGSFVLSQTTPLVIYGFASLTLVAIYGNYMLIVSAVILLMDALFNGIGAGIGNLVAEGNKEQIKKVYWELTSARIWLATVFCLVFYLFGDTFISLWVGTEYQLPRLPFLLIIIIAFIRLTRTSDAFLAAYGLYQDIWAPIVEATLNIGLSILLGHYLGLAGILLGVLTSLVFVVGIWKPYFLYSKGFKDPFKEYIMRYGKLILIAIFIVLLFYLVFNGYLNDIHTWWVWFYSILLVLSAVGVGSFFMFYAIDKSFKLFVTRLTTYVIGNKKRGVSN